MPIRANPCAARRCGQAGLEPAPRIGTKWRTEAIRGIGKRNGELLIVLDIDRVFSESELTQLQDGRGDANPETSGTVASAIA